MTALAVVPWLGEGKRIIVDEKELKKLFQEKHGKPTDPALDFEVGNIIPFPLQEAPKERRRNSSTGFSGRRVLSRWS